MSRSVAQKRRQNSQRAATEGRKEGVLKSLLLFPFKFIGGLIIFVLGVVLMLTVMPAFVLLIVMAGWAYRGTSWLFAKK